MIRIDINGSYSIIICDCQYFITFIDDFSLYGFFYSIKEKSNILEKFKVFKTEVEKQLGKVIKIKRSDHEGKYYRRHEDTSECMDPFAKHL